MFFVLCLWTRTIFSAMLSVYWRERCMQYIYKYIYIYIIYIYILYIIYIYINNMSHHQHRYPWPSLGTPPYHPLLPAGLQDCIPYRHRARRYQEPLLWVFRMTQPGIEPMSRAPLAISLSVQYIYIYIYIYIHMYMYIYIYIATLMSSYRTKQICLWMTIIYIYIYIGKLSTPLRQYIYI